jgi:flagellar assembly protein FliH
LSRIYRSIDPDPPFVKAVDVRHQHLSGGAARPRGGFHDAKPLRGGQKPVSLAEQRELQARRLIEEAQGRAESIQREAYHAGFEEGDRAGRKLALQKAEPALRALTDVADAVAGERHTLLQQHNNELIRIAFLIATHVVHKAVGLDPEIVSAVVADALKKVAKNQPITIRVSQHDLQLMQQLSPDGQTPLLASENLHMVADESIGRGGCRIVTDTGEIDATIDGQLRVLQGVLW